jgi:ribonuclease P/MRP protein subunit RPP40
MMSADWLMLFNVDKCKVMHFGYNNSKSTYKMNGKDLEEISEERDLGVIVQQDLKRSKQCSKSVSTANRILGMIKRSFCYLSKDVVLKLYKSLVRPHLEYCVQAWRPYLTLFLASRFKNSDDTECSRMGTLPGKRLKSGATCDTFF